jgi:hypothetical protein
MTKEDMVQVLRSVGVDENTVTAMGNAYDIGYDEGHKDGYQSHMVFKPAGEQNEPERN